MLLNTAVWCHFHVTLFTVQLFRKHSWFIASASQELVKTNLEYKYNLCGLDECFTTFVAHNSVPAIWNSSWHFPTSFIACEARWGQVPYRLGSAALAGRPWAEGRQADFPKCTISYHAVSCNRSLCFSLCPSFLRKPFRPRHFYNIYPAE